jgi:hypothetical protein
VIAQNSGNRLDAASLTPFLARLEAEHGDTVSAFDHLTLTIRNWHNSGDTTTLRVPLAILAALFDRLGRYEPAATIAGFALSPFSASAVPEITTAITHLRDVLGEATYEASVATFRFANACSSILMNPCCGSRSLCMKPRHLARRSSRLVPASSQIVFADPSIAHRHRDATDATFDLRCWNAAPCTCAAPTKFSVAIITGKRAVALTT